MTPLFWADEKMMLKIFKHFWAGFDEFLGWRTKEQIAPISPFIVILNQA